VAPGGGLAALIPSRTDPEATERAIATVRADKEREAAAGFDGTWVAHPGFVSAAREPFDAVLGDRPDQVARRREDVAPDAAALVDLAATPGEVTEAGLRSAISVAFGYISFWLCGRGAVVIDDLMEDAATAEVSRAQIWQWIRNATRLPDGRRIDGGLVSEMLEEEMARIRAEVGEETWEAGRPQDTHQVFEAVALGEELLDFLTEIAYERLDCAAPAWGPDL
jgi:malate synthase